ncbi:helix-turn-helix domain-containing protein [Streptomyces roseirectus]|uniref:MmyB family transcriptional regulator n=1 Tax=Streptomyces roseirectus TaxID=2768066 RepID=UPI003CCE3873
MPGLRREEVAVLAGVSTEWYTRLEKGHIGGVSEEVVQAVAQALRLDEDERTYLFDLARAARPARRAPVRRKDVPVSAQIQWMLDSMTLSTATVQNGRQDVVASNALARSVFAPLFTSATTDKHGRPNFAALLRAEAGREPHDRALRDLIGDLSTLSPTPPHPPEPRARHSTTGLSTAPDKRPAQVTARRIDPAQGSAATTHPFPAAHPFRCLEQAPCRRLPLSPSLGVWTPRLAKPPSTPCTGSRWSSCGGVRA